MDPLIIGLVAFSAILHVAWNVRLKTAGDPLRTATVGMLAAAVVIIPVGILVWVAIVALALPALGMPEVWRAILLFAGCVVILIENVARSARRSRS